MSATPWGRVVLRGVGVTVAVAAAGLLTATAALAAPTKAAERTAVTSYEFVSQSGDWVGGGQTRSYQAPTDKFRFTGNAEYLTLSVDSADGREWWSVTLAAPKGERLRPGIYRDAERAPFRTGRAPGLDVGGTGRGCNQVWGQFAIDQIETDSSGAVSVLEAGFTQNCEGPDAPALKGKVKYQAFPLGYKFASDPGDYIGGGVTKAYSGSTTVFTMGGTVANGLSLGVSGQRDGWHVELAAPRGESLKVGKYLDAQRSAFREDGHPGIDIGGNGRGCNKISGSFEITELVTNPDGTVKALAATVEQHCEGGTPALRATINYYA
ncbi:hypothetical protein N8J89_37525 [Crossiella sp. CA-258035]|uniref:hypothetical protein n=1 Tax=Crossiella sp. CA-258035 TaxID=2981138 RepID=UPI0024BC5E01|nr:hypothetical protein [Crossiella sp. CA-258035]WHT18747.1 hypothetical protein N8J89_37525 [Crossiella sp. CA-258035]